MDPLEPPTEPEERAPPEIETPSMGPAAARRVNGVNGANGADEVNGMRAGRGKTSTTGITGTMIITPWIHRGQDHRM